MDAVPTGLPNPIAAKFALVLDMSAGERAWLEQAYAETRRFAARRTLIEEDGECHETLLVRRGWAYRYRALADGRRQIINVILPGDAICMYAAIVPQVDHAIASLTELEVATLAPAQMLALFRRQPRLAGAMCWSAKREEAILGEHVVRLGRRSSYERLAHIVLELAWRLQPVGLLARDPVPFFACPLTQEMFADLLGLSAVHVNRTFQRLRAERLLEFRDGLMMLNDVSGLERVAGFRGEYLKQGMRPPTAPPAARR